MPRDRYKRRYTSLTGPRDNRPEPGWHAYERRREDSEPRKPKGGWGQPEPERKRRRWGLW